MQWRTGPGMVAPPDVWALREGVFWGGVRVSPSLGYNDGDGADNDRRPATAGQGAEAPVKLAVRNVNHTFISANGKRTEALTQVNLEVRDHEFVAIVGPSGCGKSTLLNIVSGLGRPTSGEVSLDGLPMSGISHRIGYISQVDSLLPWRTVLANVELGLEIKGVPKKQRREIARSLIDKTGLSGFEDSFPAELSGGMKKRVGIIRCLAMDP